MNTPKVHPSANEVQEAVNQQHASAWPPAVVKKCGKLCWIEIELLDEDDVGVPREPYWVKLPDGSIREGKLNDQGWVRFDQIPCGTCIVRFPGWDRQFVARASELYPVDKKYWIEVVLLDEDRWPVPDEPYSVTLPDGSIREGKLNAKGRVRISGIPEGPCQVKFPRISETELISYTNG